METNELRQQVERTRRRLWLNRWLGHLGWMVTFGAGAFIVAVVAERLLYLGIPLVNAAGLLLGLAVVGSVVWLAVRHEDRVAAAEALDRAAGLRERVTSALYCADSEEPFAQSVCGDAMNAVQRVTVTRHLGVRYPRSFNWATCAVAAALLVLWLMPLYDLRGAFAKQQATEKQRQELKTAQAAVQQSIEQVKQLMADSKALQQAKALKDLAELSMAGPMDGDDLKREAIKRMDKLSDELRKQRESGQYDELKEIKRSLRRLGMQRRAETPVEKLRQGLAKGDFRAAMEAVQKMQEQLAKAKTPANQAQIAAMQKQLADLAKQMEKLADHKRLKDEMRKAGMKKKDIEKLVQDLSKRDPADIKKELEKQGMSPEQIKKMMDKMAKSKSACSKCKGLASSLASAAQAMKGSGDMESGQAASDLTQANQQLSALEAMEQEMMDLQATLDELANQKEGLMDNEGEGEGEGECPGGGQGPGQTGGTGAGMGQMGKGAGGQVPMKKTSIKFKRERLKGPQSPGAVISEMLVDGEQLKGQATEKTVKTISAAVREATKAVERDRVPRQYHRPVKDYFKEIEDGLARPKPKPTTQR